MERLTYYTVNELKRHAREQNIPIGGLTRKADILNAILNQQSGTTIPPPPTRTISPTTGTIPPIGDLFTELSKHLTLKELKNLCTTNQEYRALCSTERFQRLLKEKQVQEDKPYQDKIDQILAKGSRGFSYYVDQKGHTISYNNTPRDVSLWENIRDLNMNQRPNFSQVSILRKIFGVTPLRPSWLGPDYIVENVTPEEVRKLLNELVRRTDFSMDNFNYLE